MTRLRESLSANTNARETPRKARSKRAPARPHRRADGANVVRERAD